MPPGEQERLLPQELTTGFDIGSNCQSHYCCTKPRLGQVDSAEDYLVEVPPRSCLEANMPGEGYHLEATLLELMKMELRRIASMKVHTVIRTDADLSDTDSAAHAVAVAADID